MIGLINSFLKSTSGFLWSFPLPALIAATGIFFTVKTRGFQFRKLKRSLVTAFHNNSTDKNGISPFAAACTALSATIGTGNIAGVAGAIALGGPGTVLWIWLTAFLGMIIKVAETVLAVKFRKKHDNEFAGGPMYYIRYGLPKALQPLATIFSLFGVLAALGSGNAVQINTATSTLTNLIDGLPNSTIAVIRICIGIFSAIIIAAVLIGGATRISRAAETLVPAMVVLYLLLAGGIIIARIEALPKAIMSIFAGAFSPQAATGGAVGSFFITMQKGISRGIFTNEAGLGTSAIAHASAHSTSPANQGLFGIFEVFVDTVIICSVTAFTILCAAPSIPYGTDPGAALTLEAFAVVYGRFAKGLLAVPICFFAFTSVIGWGLYGIRCAEFLGGTKVILPFLIVFSRL